RGYGRMKQSRNEMRPRADGPPLAQGLYDPSAERDGCGIGFIARLDARPEHRIVEDAVRILVNLEHGERPVAEESFVGLGYSGDGQIKERVQVRG
ncbi:MAG TPA: hypothetical protein VM243_05555, partial [Phycisphaerae bacterium]|nr:hypothetical protein [Phycisphaerae bacterium]